MLHHASDGCVAEAAEMVVVAAVKGMAVGVKVTAKAAVVVRATVAVVADSRVLYSNGYETRADATSCERDEIAASTETRGDPRLPRQRRH